MTEKRAMVEPNHSELSVKKQCELLELARSSYYYKPAQESELNLQIMRLIDEHYMSNPSWGVPRMTSWLNHSHNIRVNKKRVERLMKLMGLRGIVPRRKKHTSLRASEHRVFPYLLDSMNITSANQVWGSDITYIPMKKGFMYLVAIMDLYSRYVLSWELSNSLDTSFCLEALEDALRIGKPEIFNSDKGCQYTSSAFIDRLLSESIKPSMTGVGRCWDNILTERLWWSVKYEDIYLKEYEDGPHLYNGIGAYFCLYNEVRPHSALSNKTPKEVYLA